MYRVRSMFNLVMVALGVSSLSLKSEIEVLELTFCKESSVEEHVHWGLGCGMLRYRTLPWPFSWKITQILFYVIAMLGNVDQSIMFWRSKA